MIDRKAYCGSSFRVMPQTDWVAPPKFVPMQGNGMEIFMDFYIFNHLKENSVVAALTEFKETGNEEAYFRAARGLIDFSTRRLTSSDIIKEYILRVMLEHDNLPDMNSLRDYMRHDIKLIYHELLSIDWDGLFRDHGLLPLGLIQSETLFTGLDSYSTSIKNITECTSNEALGGSILAHIESFGTGKSVAYSALKWERGHLVGINHPDDICFDDLNGLEHQKKVLIANTEAFVSGKPSNDVLLTGSSGCGKSSSVKACLNLFKGRGLRLIELNKADLDDLPKVFHAIRNPILKYIIFIDDLSFEPDDTSYKLLKVALDGQAEMRGSNILIYATSNRRSLIKETWSEREGFMGDEVHRSEGLAEKKSLAARFGINLSFLTPTQNEYLEIVRDMLCREGIEMDDTLRSQALAWQINYNGFSGRSAKQFVTNILAEI